MNKSSRICAGSAMITHHYKDHPGMEDDLPDTGDSGPARRPGPITLAPGHRRSFHHEAVLAPELGDVAHRELLVVVQLKVAGQLGLLAGHRVASWGNLLYLYLLLKVLM